MFKYKWIKAPLKGSFKPAEEMFELVVGGKKVGGSERRCGGLNGDGKK